ncbi:MAG: hypothetical protein WCP62_11340 [Planctomycetota bacterium]
MNPSDLDLIHRYLDGEITEAQMLQLEQSLAGSIELRQEFVRISIIDEKLNEQLSKTALCDPTPTPTQSPTPSQAEIRLPAAPSAAVSWSSIMAMLASLALLLIALLIGSNRNQLSASQELQKMRKSLALGDRLYRVDVEQAVLPNKKQIEQHDERRPPKPSLEGAKLYVRGTDEFVLMRFLQDGTPFVTGSDGQVGWAIAPNGPVRVSQDKQRFNRDLPGHEHSIPLSNLSQGLTQIQKAYHVQIILSSPGDAGDEQDAVLVATKKRGQRGPSRIEIQYASNSGRIAQMRFIEMPYGPERLTVRLTLIDELTLPESFFHHSDHHSSNQQVVSDDIPQP